MRASKLYLVTEIAGMERVDGVIINNTYLEESLSDRLTVAVKSLSITRLSKGGARSNNVIPGTIHLLLVALRCLIFWRLSTVSIIIINQQLPCFLFDNPIILQIYMSTNAHRK